MTRVIEIVFRHKLRLFVLLFVPILLSAAFLYLQPRVYQSTANLTAIRRYATLGATGLEQDQTSTPAVTQVSAFQDMLVTRSFCIAVAQDTDLPKQLGGTTSQLAIADAIYQDLSKNIVVAATSAGTYSVSYTNKSPAIAQQVVKAAIAHFATESASQAVLEGAQLLKSYQTQLDAANQQAASATAAEAQYLQANHLSADAAQQDPGYKQLIEQAGNAYAAVATISANITTLNSQIASLNTGPEGLYSVVDPPNVPLRPQSNAKNLLLGAGVGLALGLLLSISYLLLLVRLDQSIYSPADFAIASDYPVIVQIPRLPRRSAAWIAQANGKLLAHRER